MCTAIAAARSCQTSHKGLRSTDPLHSRLQAGRLEGGSRKPDGASEAECNDTSSVHAQTNRPFHLLVTMRTSLPATLRMAFHMAPLHHQLHRRHADQMLSGPLCSCEDIQMMTQLPPETRARSMYHKGLMAPTLQRWPHEEELQAPRMAQKTDGLKHCNCKI